MNAVVCSKFDALQAAVWCGSIIASVEKSCVLNINSTSLFFFFLVYF